MPNAPTPTKGPARAGRPSEHAWRRGRRAEIARSAGASGGRRPGRSRTPFSVATAPGTKKVGLYCGLEVRRVHRRRRHVQNAALPDRCALPSQSGLRNCLCAKAQIMRDASGPFPSLKGWLAVPPLHACANPSTATSVATVRPLRLKSVTDIG
jgi:hypothetical protein